jgi:hypothetical protein
MLTAKKSMTRVIIKVQKLLKKRKTCLLKRGVRQELLLTVHYQKQLKTRRHRKQELKFEELAKRGLKLKLQTLKYKNFNIIITKMITEMNLKRNKDMKHQISISLDL